MRVSFIVPELVPQSRCKEWHHSPKWSVLARLHQRYTECSRHGSYRHIMRSALPDLHQIYKEESLIKKSKRKPERARAALKG